MAFTVKTKADPHKVLISGISASIESGRVLAIMGPSGAGKTVLLNAITLDAMGGKTTGEVKLNGADLSLPLFRRHCAVCTQEDWHWAYLTCRETLAYAADLYLGGGGGGGGAATAAEKASTVAKLLADLGLTGCADTRVGNQFVKGLSGGQKRRLSIAVVLIKRPAVLFLDEPTSGLDAAAAVGVMKAIRDLAVSANVAVVCTIHQPSALIYNSFDCVMVLADGRVSYRGSAESAEAYFASVGHACPEDVTVAEFMLNCVNREFSSPAQVDAINGAWAAQDRLAPRGDEALRGCPPLKRRANDTSYGTQVATLMRRHVLLTRRDPTLYLGRALVFLFSCIFMALVYVEARHRNQQQALSRMWLVLWIIGVPANLAIIAVYVFNEEYKAVRKEWRNGMTAAGAYLTAKTVIEVPMMIALSVMALGSSAYGIANFDSAHFGMMVLFYALILWSFECMAQLFAVLFANPMMGMLSFMNSWFSAFLFAGVMIKSEDVIWPFRLLCYILPLGWGVQGMLYIEYSDSTFAGAETAGCPAALAANPPPGCTYHPALMPADGFRCAGSSQNGCYGSTGLQVLQSMHSNYEISNAEDIVARNFGYLVAIGLAFKLQYFVVLMMRMKKCSKIEPAKAAKQA